ncbi:MAG: glycosyltransferase, partial [Stellaceae bacterium]
MTRLVQLMAGAEHGGAEAFFTRLAIALQHAGQEQHVALRPYPARIGMLRAAGVATVGLPFRGGWFDFATRGGLRSLVDDYRPRVVLSWMNRATSLCPRGDFVHVARLGGYYDLEYYRGCDHLIANTRGIAAYL